MSTSPLGGRVSFSASYLNGDDPVDTVLARDAILNTALHWGDEVARPLFTWGALSPTYSTGQQQFRAPSLSAVDTWGRVMPVGPLSLTVSAGSPYRLRVRLGAASDAGDAVDFMLVLTGEPSSTLGIAMGALAGFTVQWSGVTSSSPAWLSGPGGNDYVELATSAFRWASWTTLDDLSGTSQAVQVAEVYADLYARTANLASTPQVWGLHVAEFVGA